MRQGRVLILLPDRLLQLNAEDPDHAQVERLRRADQTALGAFTAMTPARDGGLWISGARGVAKIAGPLRQLKPDDRLGDRRWGAGGDCRRESTRRDFTGGDFRAPDFRRGRRTGRHALAGHVGWLVPPRAGGLANGGGARRGAAAAGGERATRSPPWCSPAGRIAGRGEWPTRFRAQNGDVWLGGRHEIAWRHQNSWQIFASTNQIGPEEVVGFAEAPDGRVLVRHARQSLGVRREELARVARRV